MKYHRSTAWDYYLVLEKLAMASIKLSSDQSPYHEVSAEQAGLTLSERHQIRGLTVRGWAKRMLNTYRTTKHGGITYQVTEKGMEKLVMKKGWMGRSL